MKELLVDKYEPKSINEMVLDQSIKDFLTIYLRKVIFSTMDNSSKYEGHQEKPKSFKGA